MLLQKPKRLKRGNKVAAVTLSYGGPGCFPQRYDAGKRQLSEAFGVDVIATKHALRDPDWIYHHPKERAEDLMAAFADQSISAIIATIGGDESVRILPYLDLEVIRRNPKIFMGYSDTTVAHFACLKAGLMSFYGPSFMAGFAENGGMFPYMTESLHKTLFKAEPIGAIAPNTSGWTVEFLDWGVSSNQSKKRQLSPADPWRWLQGQGVVKGRLLGGCSEVLEFIKGTDYWPANETWNDSILFLENSEEAPSAVAFKRWLRNYGSMGLFDRINGVIFGRPGGPMEVEQFETFDKALIDIIAVEFGRPDLPVISHMDFGHSDPMFVIPYGALAEIDCEKRRFSIVESAVTD